MPIPRVSISRSLACFRDQSPTSPPPIPRCRQYLPLLRYNFESTRRKEKCRDRIHDASANATRNRKGPYQSRDTTSIRISHLIPSVISLNKYNRVARIQANYFRGDPPAIKNCISRIRIILAAQPHCCNGKIIPDTIYDVHEIHSFSLFLHLSSLPPLFYLQNRRQDGKYFTIRSTMGYRIT